MTKKDKKNASKVEECRLCNGELGPIAFSLGDQPISNRLPAKGVAVDRYPLEVALCRACGLPQLAHHIDADEHFHDEYTYLSGASETWVQHCRDYASDISIEYGIDTGGLIVEVGSNDGTLLRALEDRGHTVLGVEPSRNVAEIANSNGSRTLNAFFNKETATQIREEFGGASMVVGNNVLAHVPDTNEFLEAARDLLVEDGLLCFEFPHFTNIIEKLYFDTIYHEHYTYLGVGPLAQWADQNGMRIVRVDEQSTHGGTLRVLLARGVAQNVSDEVARIVERESPYRGEEAWHELSKRLIEWKDELRTLLEDKRARGERIVGYAAASKATVLLNYLDISSDTVEYCCDASEFKQGRYIPGANVPVVQPDKLLDDSPDAVIVFAWNIVDEIQEKVSELISKPVELISPLPDIRTTTVFPKGQA